MNLKTIVPIDDADMEYTLPDAPQLGLGGVKSERDAANEIAERMLQRAIGIISNEYCEAHQKHIKALTFDEFTALIDFCPLCVREQLNAEEDGK